MVISTCTAQAQSTTNALDALWLLSPTVIVSLLYWLNFRPFLLRSCLHIVVQRGDP
jgi:hypothetical protein